MTINQRSPEGLLAADVATLTGRHLILLSRVEKLADRLTADMPVAEAIAELRTMTAEARS